MELPSNSKQLLAEINEYVLSLPQPINQLFLLDIYKLYLGHKIDHTINQIISEFAATQTNAE